ncbi:uncharacterized protein LOC129588474 isoform X2 [Paramacrobiotus metropolitanus]|uniref:uncharacterized protein LOC129588474 isoform X2 n=1 Tax=Paramacrobiotus metropolitanus TaxID=2943436 RepID=UPI002445B956|nr:uncharacterized protein LOC129588474 isoform X2 [Paramacrobiotus metropolitanus]
MLRWMFITAATCVSLLIPMQISALWTYPGFITTSDSDSVKQAILNLVHFVPKSDPQFIVQKFLYSDPERTQVTVGDSDLTNIQKVTKSKRAERQPLVIEALESGAGSLALGDSGAFDCHPNDESVTKATCPTLDRRGRYRCITSSMLCDGKRHCPNGEDENDLMCMFYKLVRLQCPTRRCTTSGPTDKQ